MVDRLADLIAELVELADRQRSPARAAALVHAVADRLGVHREDDPAELRDGIWAAMSLAHYEMPVVQRSWPTESYRDCTCGPPDPGNWLWHR